jgi:hypothetical protein
MHPINMHAYANRGKAALQILGRKKDRPRVWLAPKTRAVCREEQSFDDYLTLYYKCPRGEIKFERGQRSNSSYREENRSSAQ